MKQVLALCLLLAAVHAAPLEVQQNQKETGVPHELQPFVTNSEGQSSREEKNSREGIFKIHSNFGGLRRLSDDLPSESGQTSLEESDEAEVKTLQPFGDVMQFSRRLGNLDSLESTGEHVQGAEESLSPVQLKFPLDNEGQDKRRLGHSAEEENESSVSGGGSTVVGSSPINYGVVYAAASSDRLAHTLINSDVTESNRRSDVGVHSPAGSGSHALQQALITDKEIRIHGDLSSEEEGATDVSEYAITGGSFGHSGRETTVGGTAGTASAVSKTPGSTATGSGQSVSGTGVATPHAEVSKDAEDTVSVHTGLEDTASVHEQTGNKESVGKPGGFEGDGKGLSVSATSVAGSGASFPAILISHSYHQYLLADNNEGGRVSALTNKDNVHEEHFQKTQGTDAASRLLDSAPAASGDVSLPTVRDGQASVVIKDLPNEPLSQPSKAVVVSGTTDTVGQSASDTQDTQNNPKVFHGPAGGYGMRIQESRGSSLGARDAEDESGPSQQTTEGNTFLTGASVTGNQPSAGELTQHGIVSADVDESGAAVSGGKLDSSPSVLSAPVGAQQQGETVSEGNVVGSTSRPVTLGDTSRRQGSTTASKDKEDGEALHLPQHGRPEDGSGEAGRVFGDRRKTVVGTTSFIFDSVSTTEATDAHVGQDEMNDSTLPSAGVVSAPDTSNTSPTEHTDHEKSFDTTTSFLFREGSERPRGPGNSESATTPGSTTVFPSLEKQQSTSSNAANFKPTDGGSPLIKNDEEVTSVTFTSHGRNPEAKGPIHVLLSGKSWSVGIDDASFLGISHDMRKELTQFATHIRKADFPSLSEEFGRRLSTSRPAGVPVAADQHGVFKVGSSLKDTLEEFDKLVGDGDDERIPEVARSSPGSVHQTQMTAPDKKPVLEEPVVKEEASLLCPEGVHMPDPAGGSRHASHAKGTFKCRDHVTKDMSDGREVDKEQASEQNSETNGFVQTELKSYSGDLPVTDVPSEAGLSSGNNAEQSRLEETGVSKVSSSQVQEHDSEGKQSDTRNFDESTEGKKFEERNNAVKTQGGVVVFLAESKDSITDGISLERGPSVGEQEQLLRRHDEVTAHVRDDVAVRQEAVSESSTGTLQQEPKLTAVREQVSYVDKEHSTSEGKEKALPEKVEGKAEEAATISLGVQKTEGGILSMGHGVEVGGHGARDTAEVHGVSDSLVPGVVGLPSQHAQGTSDQNVSTTEADAEQHAAKQVQREDLGGALRGPDKEQPHAGVKDVSVAAVPETGPSGLSHQAEYKNKQANDSASTDSKVDESLKDDQTTVDSHDEDEYPIVQGDESLRGGQHPGSDGYIPAEARGHEENATGDGTQEPGTTATVMEGEISTPEATLQQDTESHGSTDSTEQYVPEKQHTVAHETADDGGHTPSRGDEYGVPKVTGSVHAAGSLGGQAGISQEHDVTTVRGPTQAPGLHQDGQTASAEEEHGVPSLPDHTQAPREPQDSDAVRGLEEHDVPVVRDHTQVTGLRQDDQTVPGVEGSGVPSLSDHTQGPEESQDSHTVREHEEYDVPVASDHTQHPGQRQHDRTVPGADRQGVPSLPDPTQGPEVPHDSDAVRGLEEHDVSAVRDHTQAPGLHQDGQTVLAAEEQDVPSLPDHTHGPVEPHDGHTGREPEEQDVPIVRDHSQVQELQQDDHIVAVTKEVDDHLDVPGIPSTTFDATRLNPLPCDHPTVDSKATSQRDAGLVMHQTHTGVPQQEQQYTIHHDVPTLQHHSGLVTAPHYQSVSTGTQDQEQGPFAISRHYSSNFSPQHQDPHPGSVSPGQPSSLGIPYHYPGGFIIVHPQVGGADASQVETGVPHKTPQHHVQASGPSQLQTDLPYHEPSAVDGPPRQTQSGTTPPSQSPQPHQLVHAVGPSDSLLEGGVVYIQPDGVTHQHPLVISGAEHQPHDIGLHHLHGAADQRELGETSQNTGAAQTKTSQHETYVPTEQISQPSPGSEVSFVQHVEHATIPAPVGHSSQDFLGLHLHEPVASFGLHTATSLQTPESPSEQPQQDDPIAKYFVNRVVAPVPLPQGQLFGGGLSGHSLTQAQNEHSQQMSFPVTSEVQHFGGVQTPGTLRTSELTPGIQEQPTVSTLPQATAAHEFVDMGQLTTQQQPASPELETVRIPYPPYYITFKRDQASQNVHPNQHAQDNSPGISADATDAKPYKDSERAFGEEGPLRDLAGQALPIGRIVVSEGPITFQPPLPAFHFNTQAFGTAALTPVLPNHGGHFPVFQQPQVFAPPAGHHHTLVHGHFTPSFQQQPSTFYNLPVDLPVAASTKSKLTLARPSKMLKSLKQAVASKLPPSGLRSFSRFRSARQQPSQTARRPKLLSSGLSFRQQRSVPHLPVQRPTVNQPRVLGLRMKAGRWGS